MVVGGEEAEEEGGGVGDMLKERYDIRPRFNAWLLMGIFG